MLTEYTALPAGLLDATPAALATILPGPSLIHLPGRREPALFASVLLHGNEATGWLAAQAVLRKYADTPLPRALSLFIGNVEAAAAGLRRLDGQIDFNRVWPGHDGDPSPESAMMQRVVDVMRARGLFASIDIHNNTGLNPHYACVNRLHQRTLHLALLFSRVVVYFTRPRGVQSAAFAECCPAVTVECGKSGAPESTRHAADFMEACLNLSEFPAHAVAPQDIDLFHTVATVKVPDAVRFGFSQSGVDISFLPELDHFNFRELARGVCFGAVRPGSQARLQVSDETGADIGEHVFDYQNDRVVLRRPLMPAMLTRDERVIRQDCLCYLMERLHAPSG